MNERARQLHEIARNYVANLGAGDFDSIPYVEAIELRAPLCPGGSAIPLIGRDNLKETWWAPLPDLVSRVELIDSYVNEELSALTVEFLCHIDAISTGRQDLPYGVQITIQTNATVQPVSLRLHFSNEITEGDVGFTGMGSILFYLTTRISGKTFSFKFNGPAFTPSRALRVTVLAKSPVMFERAERTY